MTKNHGQWGQFRLQVIGQLLAAPPTERGELAQAVRQLAEREWTHPVKGESIKFGASTIERWYYRALKSQTDTQGALDRRRRADTNSSKLELSVTNQLRAQYRDHPSWSAKLHFDNLQAFARDKKISDSFSYQSVRRYLRKNGLVRTKRRRGLLRAGELAAHQKVEKHEVRSYEASHVGGLWHLDFHHAKRPVLTPQGEWVTPILFATIDDRSRLICHLQWYLTETTKDLVHGFSQALMRRGLPRLLMTDNGAAMTSHEFTEGLSRLGILHETTLPYSPHQNGKMECYWGQIEGRLMAMLESKRELSLAELNRMTHAWVEMDYHHQVHSETKQTPIDRFITGPSVLRPCPESKLLPQAFRQETQRIQRRSDGTIMIEGTRFEIPNRFRHVEKVTVRYARWDLSEVSLVSAETNQVICPLYPLDKERNGDGQRRQLIASPSTDTSEQTDELPPYLSELMKRFAESGVAPPFITQNIED